MSAPSDLELRVAVSDALGPVARLDRAPSPDASSADLFDVHVELVDGRRTHLLLKASGRDTPRESRFYRQVLTATPDTPRLLAMGGDWLLLRTVPGVPLWQAAGVGAWQAAAALLARIHQRLRTAADDVGPATGTSYAAQFERALAREPRTGTLAAQYDAAVAALGSLPQTVIHGEAFASNFVVGDDGQTCLVDWETAGRGCGLTDLAALVAGWDGATRRSIAAAYGGDLTHLAAARLVVAVRWLGEPPPSAGAGGGLSRHTDWWAEAQGRHG